MGKRTGIFTLHMLHLASVVAVLVVLTAVYRLAVLGWYGPAAGLTGLWGQVWHAFGRGVRFDVQVAGYLFIPLLLLGMRGRFTHSPLAPRDAYIFDKPFLGALCVNPAAQYVNFCPSCLHSSD
ncbi:MAG: hypothetical protein LBU95_02935 [Rikenellaceae bacterium]|jgi:hypothetical protein|nr:hypothetical protein [Rikenellaceae bacterium]